jgi:hypothetical protein
MSVPQKMALASEILIVYVRVRRQMRRGDIRDVVASIRTGPASRTAPVEAGSPNEWLTAARLANAVARTLRALPADTRCLSQSLVLLWLLSRRAISSTLVIGAHTRPEFEAHAWIEHRGRPLLTPAGFSDDRLVEI